MDRTLRQHIEELEHRVRELNGKIMEDDCQQAERNRIESEIRIAELALGHYRNALELELQIKKA